MKWQILHDFLGNIMISPEDRVWILPEGHNIQTLSEGEISLFAKVKSCDICFIIFDFF